MLEFEWQCRDKRRLLAPCGSAFFLGLPWRGPIARLWRPLPRHCPEFTGVGYLRNHSSAWHLRRNAL